MGNRVLTGGRTPSFGGVEVSFRHFSSMGSTHRKDETTANPNMKPTTAFPSMALAVTTEIRYAA
tara:strand:- start:844 stop:1035 length:192 start_codon:yes stop_codon:yes gene_type:complete